MKVALIFDHFGPYHLARGGAAAGVVNISCIELHGRSRSYGWDREASAQELSLVSLPETAVKGRAERSFLEPHLARALETARPDVVAINGWGDFMSVESLRWCVRHGIPAIVMSESTAWDELRRPHREWLKRRLVKMFSAGLVGGIPQKEYLVQLGLPAADVEIGYNAVDNEYFAAEAAKVRDRRTEAEGQGPEPYFLASARFIPKKNLRCLIEAYAEYSRSSDIGDRRSETAQRKPWDLFLLGDGPMRGELTQTAMDLGLEVRSGAPWEWESEDCKVQSAEGGVSVFRYSGKAAGRGVLWLPGFRQIEELPRFYAGAGCFVHASTTEQWGLVVNEAMACGLPVIVSERCGCAHDLVQDGMNGFRFDPGNTEHLASLMAKVSAPDFPRADFGDAGRRIVAEFGPERFAHGLKAAALHAVKKGPHRPSLLDRLILDLVCRR